MFFLFPLFYLLFLSTTKIKAELVAAPIPPTEEPKVRPILRLLGTFLDGLDALTTKDYGSDKGGYRSTDGRQQSLQLRKPNNWVPVLKNMLQLVERPNDWKKITTDSLSLLTPNGGANPNGKLAAWIQLMPRIRKLATGDYSEKVELNDVANEVIANIKPNKRDPWVTVL